MFGERGDGAECLATLVTLDLHPAVDVHPLVSVQVAELSVRLVTHLAAEWFDRAVNVSVLLETTGCCKCFTTLRAGVAPATMINKSIES